MKDIKHLFKERVDRLIESFNEYKSGLEFSLKLSQLYDEQIKELTKDSPDDIAIAAIGGFGRMELSPYSDVDLIFITSPKSSNNDFIANVVRTLWDSGINVSHSVRNLNQIYDFVQNDFAGFTQFLEMRFVSGSYNLFLRFLENVKSIVNSNLKTKLLESLLSDIEKRHLIFGNSPLLLEPNIKNTKGGIRDLHSAAWIYYILTNQLPVLNNYETAFDSFILSLVNADFISGNFSSKIISAYDYILKTRNALHIMNSNGKDKFDFQSQFNLTRSLNTGVNEIDKLHYNFMLNYYKSSLLIAELLDLFIKKSMTIIYPCEIYTKYKLDENFSLCGRFIDYESKENLDLTKILQGFYYSAKYSAIFTDRFEYLIKKKLEYLDGTEIENIEVKLTFRKILQFPDDISETLIKLHRTGLLEFLIPEFSNLSNYFQPNSYHIYTADEHTLQAVKNVFQLALSDSLLGEIFRKYENKELLILAILFHDIAKPYTNVGHEILGAQIAENVMQRFGYDENEIELVSFLVSNHLIMEQTAFRRNLNDVNILNPFRQNFKDIQQLDFLYLLTYADLSSVNPSLWTSWKNSLLNELYLKTKEMIVNNLTAEELFASKTQKIDFQKHQINEEEYLYHIDQINDINYLYTFSENEIAEHIREIKKGNELSILHNQLDDCSIVTLITKDSPGLLSKICGSFSISDCNIHDANIFTRKDKIVIDSFRVTDFITGKPLSTNHYEIIAENLSRVLLQNYDLSKAFIDHLDKWKRVDKKMNSDINVSISFEEHPIYTIIDIHCSDRIGLLYMITKKLTSLGLNIYFAKIGTKLNGVFDSFYVLDKNFRKISTDEYDFYRKEIIKGFIEFGKIFSES